MRNFTMRAFCLLSFLVITKFCSAQTSLTVSMPQATDSTLVLLARHQLDKILRVDSAYVSISKPEVSLKIGKEHGLYTIIIKGKTPIPVTVTDAQPFKVVVNFDSLNQYHVEVIGSQENANYHSYISSLKPYTSRLTALKSQFDWLRKMGMKDKTVYDDLNRDVTQAQDSIRIVQAQAVTTHKDEFWTKMISAMMPPTLPDSLRTQTNTPNGKAAIQQFMKANYWSNYDFSDKRLYHTAVFQNKLDYWLGMHLSQIDTLIKAIDQLYLAISPYPEYLNHSLVYAITKFEQPDIFDGDKVIVHVADKYIRKVGDGGTDLASFERIKYKADAFRPTLNGLVAPEISMSDSLGVVRRLSDTKAKYTVLYFFSPMCDKCKEVTPKVLQYLQNYPPETVQVFAVTLDDQTEHWKSYIKQLEGWICVHDTANPHPIEKLYVLPNLPAIFLLDEEKKIIAKRFTAEKLAEILNQMVGEK